MAITIDKNGNGYFHGFKVVAETYCDTQRLIKFKYLEGMHKGKALFQPAECVDLDANQ